MSNNDDLFGGMFDINGDGKTDIVEEYLQFNYLKEAAKTAGRKIAASAGARRAGSRIYPPRSSTAPPVR